MIQVATIVGARPQFVKAAVVSRAMQKREGVEEILIHTGQHYDQNMSDVFFDELKIPKPDYNLNINEKTHGAQTGKMLEAIETVLLKHSPDWVLVYGDTNSTLAGALAASKLHIPIAHVEAGLRSFNRRMPEEINRVVTDHVSDALFTPSSDADKNLAQEGIASEKIFRFGDVMMDANRFYSSLVGDETGLLQTVGVESGQFILGTIHRAESTNNVNCLKAIFRSLIDASSQLPVVIPLHPRTKHALQREGLYDSVIDSSIVVIDPVGFLGMIQLEKHARFIVTDSGGVQKEAYFQNKRCVTLRTETEWVELVEQGWNEVVDPSDEKEITNTLLKTIHHYATPQRGTNLYGEGNAGEKIVAHISTGV